MQLRAEQLEAHLAKRLEALYTIHGDEPLLALEAADAVRAAARRGGCEERVVLQVERGFDWSALSHAGASQSLFGGRRLIELRMPSGKPGTEGAAAIERYCERLSQSDVTLVSLPRLDRTTQGGGWFGALREAGAVVDVWPLDRARLPQWIAARLARNGQRVAPDALEFLANRVEGNLLAAHQEVQKLALLAPPGELSLAHVEQSVANVARYDVHDAPGALLSGDLARYLRVLDGLHGEGEAAALVLWSLAEDLRALAAILAGRESGRAVDALMREQRVWGARQAVLQAALGRHRKPAIDRALAHAARVDRMVKGVAAGDVWEELARLGLEFIHGQRRVA
ncbi:MAG TPA: DNA polymerase III subunit delta [Burkholderiales bacterium]|nr:DNA polymerase III subunit delta [Burkholderiales bacterium]